MLKPIDKVKLARLYKELTGFDFVPPREDRPIRLEGKVEDTEELTEMMSQIPNYTISKEGRG